MAEALDLSNADIVIRTALAVALGGVIGLEREIDAKEAGFRTHVVLALGAALFGMISVSAFAPFVAGGDTNVRMDITRVGAQVAIGVGFIGAGVILKQRGSVRGLTTAASVWLTAAVGLAVGVGFYAPAITVTAAALVALFALRGARQWLRRRVAREEQTIVLHLVPGADPGAVIREVFALPDTEVRSLDVDRDVEDEAYSIEARLRGSLGVRLADRVAPLVERPDVGEVELFGR